MSYNPYSIAAKSNKSYLTPVNRLAPGPTQEQKDLIKKFYPLLDKEVLEALTGMTYNNIRQWAQKMGVRRRIHEEPLPHELRHAPPPPKEERLSEDEIQREQRRAYRSLMLSEDNYQYPKHAKLIIEMASGKKDEFKVNDMYMRNVKTMATRTAQTCLTTTAVYITIPSKANNDTDY